jgi:hypothetical protein
MEALHLGLLAVVGLHQRGIREALLRHGADRSAAAPLLTRGALDQAGEAPGGEPEERCHEQGHEREVPLEVEERRTEEEDLEQVGERVGHAREHEGLDRRDVAREPGDHVAETAPVEEVERQALEMAEEAGAQGEQEAFAHPGGDVVVEEGGSSVQERQPEVGERDPPERAEIVGHEHVVHHELEHPDARGLDRGNESDQDEADEQPAPVGPGVRPERSEDLPDRHRRRFRHQRIALE